MTFYQKYIYIYYEDKNDSYIYGSPLQVNNNQDISYNYNTHKRRLIQAFPTKLYADAHNYLESSQ